MNSHPALRRRANHAALGASILLFFAATAWAGEIRTLKIDGLACPFCSYGIEKQLRAVNGVKAVKVSVKSGTVTVVMKDGAKLSQARASRAVRDAGFTLRSFR